MPTTPTWVPFGWPVALYLCLAGLAAGSGLLTAGGLFRGRRILVRRGALLASGAVVLGAVGLVADLERADRFWFVIAELNPRSAISWGSRVLPLFALWVGFLAVLTRAAGTGDLGAGPLPAGPAKGSARRSATGLAGGGLALLALALAFYPGLVLAQQSAARPAWSGPWLPALLGISALHMGLALVHAPGLRGPSEPPLLGSRGLRWIEVGIVVCQGLLAVLWLTSVHAAAPPVAARLLVGTPGLALWLGFGLVGMALPAFAVAGRGWGPDAGPPGPWHRGVLVAAPIVGGCCLRLAVLFGGQGAAAFV